MKELYEDQLEFQIKEANILLEMEGATDLNEWLSEFASLLAHRLPSLLLEYFGIRHANGCLESEPRVTVTIEEKRRDEEESLFREQVLT